MKKYSSLLWFVTGGFSLGVLWRSFFDWGFAPIVFIVLCAVGSALLYMVREKRTVFLITTLVFFSVAMGMARFAIDDVLHTADVSLAEQVGSPVVFTGTISDEPDDRGTYTRLVVDVDALFLSHEENKTSIHDRVLVYAPRYPRVTYGDRVKISGKFTLPEAITQEDGRVFLFQEYLKKDNIHFVVSYPKLEVLAHEKHTSLYGVLFSIKHSFLNALRRVLPEPQVSLLGGLVVGAKEAMGTELLDQFRRVGIVHIVVLSGYNVAVIAKTVMRLLVWLPRTAGWGAGAVFIILFAMLTGGSATIIRASSMVLLVFLAEASGRKFDALRALFATALVMICFNPRILAFDPSFQLSFLATFGLITLSPSIEQFLKHIPSMFGMREILSATIATELFVLPILLWMTGTFSVIAPVVNILVLPTVPFVMLIGAVTGALALCSTVLALPISAITYLVLSYQLWIVEKGATLPFAAIKIPHVSVWLLVLAYALLFFFFRKVIFRSSEALHQNETQ